MYKKKRIGESRAFLNLPYETSLTSCVSYTITVSSYIEDLIKEEKFEECNISFAMADCHKSIYLDFRINTKEEMRNSLFKLDTIIENCEKMKKDLKEARLIILEGVKRAEELKSK